MFYPQLTNGYVRLCTPIRLIGFGIQPCLMQYVNIEARDKAYETAKMCWLNRTYSHIY